LSRSGRCRLEGGLRYNTVISPFIFKPGENIKMAKRNESNNNLFIITVIVAIALFVVILITNTCSDSDFMGTKEQAYYARGMTNGITDVCSGRILTENYCQFYIGEFGFFQASEEYECPYKCNFGSDSGSCVVFELDASGNSTGCSDSDGGSDIFTKGYAKKGDIILNDYCSTGTGTLGSSVFEARCMGSIGYVETSCGHYGCGDGACLPSPDCSDSDGGKDFFEKGTASGPTSMGDTRTLDDTCINNESYFKEYAITQPYGGFQVKGIYKGDYLAEAFCGDGPRVVAFKCPNGCEDGACIISN